VTDQRLTWFRVERFQPGLLGVSEFKRSDTTNSNKGLARCEGTRSRRDAYIVEFLLCYAVLQGCSLPKVSSA
jgi:hypothetical protein